VPAAAGSADPAFSAACERNKGPILEVLQTWLAPARTVLEIGSGTGQHAVYFARQLPWLTWQPTDTGDYLAVLRAALRAARPANLCDPLELDVRGAAWPPGPVDAVFSANTLHFMSPSAVAALFAGCAALLPARRLLLVYGPFRYGGEYTAPSNARFDEWLQASHPERGVRDFEWVQSLATGCGFELSADIAMPANNQLLIWRKAPGAGQAGA
jgi:cyclopropane fatty-acyl-phospholipid synthase-like methyltransferase